MTRLFIGLLAPANKDVNLHMYIELYKKTLSTSVQPGAAPRF